MRKFFTHSDPVMPVHIPRVVVETAVAQGVDRDALFENTDMAPDMLDSPDTRMTFVQHALFMANALRLTDNPALGLDVGKNLGFPQLGVVGLAIMTSPTVGEALQAAIRYHSLINPYWRLALRVEGTRATLAFEELIPFGPLEVFTMDIAISAFDRQGRALAGRALPVRVLRLCSARPDHADRYRAIYDAPILFEQPAREAEFDADVLEQPVPFADPATAKLTAQLCDALAAREDPPEGLVTQVRTLLLAAPGRPPGPRDLAQALQTSSRSLSRSLKSMGSSYQELLDESRRIRAEEWVRTTPMPFEAIAERLGFSDVRSFRRAFKRWTSRTPGEYREAVTALRVAEASLGAPLPHAKLSSG